MKFGIQHLERNKFPLPGIQDCSLSHLRALQFPYKATWEQQNWAVVPDHMEAFVHTSAFEKVHFPVDAMLYVQTQGAQILTDFALLLYRGYNARIEVQLNLTPTDFNDNQVKAKLFNLLQLDQVQLTQSGSSPVCAAPVDVFLIYSFYLYKLSITISPGQLTAENWKIKAQHPYCIITFRGSLLLFPVWWYPAKLTIRQASDFSAQYLRSITSAL